MSTLTMTTTLIPFSSTISVALINVFRNDVLWALIMGIILAFVLGFAMGANDVANAFGTSVGSKVLTLRQAYILAVIFETLGALLIGYNVTDTVRKGVIDLTLYEKQPKEIFVGQIAILGGCSLWLLIATLARLPVSSTHSITGATVGFGLMTRGIIGIQWRKIIHIVASWFMSPILSGVVSAILYIILDHSVLRRKNPFRCGLRALPIFYWLCIAFNVFTVSYQGSKLLHLSKLPMWICALVSVGCATIGAIVIHFFLSPKLKIWINNSLSNSSREREDSFEVQTISGATESQDNILHQKCQTSKVETVSGLSVNEGNKTVDCEAKKNGKEILRSQLTDNTMKFIRWILPVDNRITDDRTMKIFSSIQAFTACFAGFAHGANDVGNAIAPLTALISIYSNLDVRQRNETPIYVLLYGVLAICVGLVVLGHRVIRTIGTDMSTINAASGFTIEFGAAVTSLTASKLGLPISTTHSLVGSVIFVGMIRARKGVQWSIFRNIALSWILTLPISGLITMGLMLILKFSL
ncbi:Phosphate transporter family protein [Brugia pahangi]